MDILACTCNPRTPKGGGSQKQENGPEAHGKLAWSIQCSRRNKRDHTSTRTPKSSDFHMHVPMCVFAHPPMLKHISMDEISKIEFKKKKFKIAKAIATPRALFMLSK